MKRPLVIGLFVGIVSISASFLSYWRIQWTEIDNSPHYSKTLLDFFKTDLKFELDPAQRDLKKFMLACATHDPNHINEALLNFVEVTQRDPAMGFVLINCLDSSLADALLGESPYSSMPEDEIIEILERTNQI